MLTESNNHYYYSYRVFMPGPTISVQTEIEPSPCRTSCKGAIELARGSAIRECDNGGEFQWKVYDADPNKGGKAIAHGYGLKQLDGTVVEDDITFPPQLTKPCAFKVIKGGAL